MEKKIAVKLKESVQLTSFDDFDENREKSIEISGNDLTEQVISCVLKSKRARLFYEKWEFIKSYKYSVLYTCDEFNDVLKKVSEIKPLEEECENEYTFEPFTILNPVAHHEDNYDFLKFNMSFSAIHPQTQEEFLNKYPILVVFHKKSQLIEFRFDVVKQIYISGKRESTIYANLISRIKSYVEKTYLCSLKALDLNFMVNVSKCDSTVKLIAQYMKLPSGGNAQLEVGNNQEYVLPFIGELKSLIVAHQCELEKAPTFKDALEQFMFEMEEMSDYPWIELLWENEIKTRSIHVKFIFNYMDHEYCLIQYYYSNYWIEMERMNYVVKYIVDHRNDAIQNEK